MPRKWLNRNINRPVLFLSLEKEMVEFIALKVGIVWSPWPSTQCPCHQPLPKQKETACAWIMIPPRDPCAGSGGS